MSGQVPNLQHKEELHQLLRSSIFANAPAQSKLLKYICEEYFGGRADRIKEYVLATEVFGRGADFDQNQDAIVRVEAHRLRKKLSEYYEGEGANHPIQIVIEPGHYVPRFVAREQNSSLRPDGDTGLTEDRRSTRLASRQRSSETAEPAVKHPRRLASRAVVGGLAFIAVLAALVLERGRHAGSFVEPSPGVNRPGFAVSPGLTRPIDTVRILAGHTQGDYIDRAGNRWMADHYSSGGEVASQQHQFIARTADSRLYEQWRQGEFSYDIPLKPGLYELHLFFAEPEFGPDKLHGGGESSRVFNVLLNGEPLLFQFDIMRDTATNETADERVFTDIHPAPDGFLHLRFVKQTDYPLVNALELIPGLPGKMHPVRIAASDNSYTDHNGTVWLPDRYSIGGRLANHNVPIKGSADPDLYVSQRFGYFNYAIPVASGSRYTATLHFAETYFGPDNPGQGGEGSRLFDVYCNGTTLLRNFDILKEAGRANRTLVKTFHGLAPNAQRKLIFNFVPVRNYACLNAIEVAPE